MMIDCLKRTDVSKTVTLEGLSHPAGLVRVNAIEAAVKLAKDHDDLIDVLAQEATRQENEVRLLGTTTIGHVAVRCLMQIGSERAKEVARHLVNEWPAEDRADLQWYLASEGVPVASADQ